MIHDNAWNIYNEQDLEALEKLSKDYIDFLSDGKTERECTDILIGLAEANGYRNLEDVIEANETLAKGDKIYANNMGKALMLLNIGDDIIGKGMNILGGHLDSPRLDLKQRPLYESNEIAYFNTHYYGGIKKYQWVTIPMALHGVVCLKDGTTVKLAIGEKEDDPVFFISDLLIHLAKDQIQLKANEVITGEALDVIIGSKPLKGEEKDAVKANVLAILKETYGIEDDDFISAEIEVVPAGRAREAGFDRSMIFSYGHDDRCCSYPSAIAMFDMPEVETTACGLFVDKEEIGSVGATGMESRFFENTMREVLDRMGIYSELNLARCLKHCRMLSSDVNAAYDPSYADRFDKDNASYMGHGLVFCKYTGGGGKSGSNDANAEYLAKLRKVMDDNNVVYQTAELGGVDKGGGGTIAYILSLYGMEVIDSGIAVLSMHAPWETISKADLYEAYKGYKAFLTM